MTAGPSRPASDGLLEVHLRLSLGADPVSGRVVGPSGHPVDFEGYVELIATLERLLHPRPPT